MSPSRKPRNTKPTGIRKGKSLDKTKPKPNFTKKRPAPKKSSLDQDEIRLNKYISNSGICTRKDADLYIKTGSVRVNGEVITEMGHKVKLTDEVRFDGQLITPEKKVYILLNKPKGFTIEKVSTNDKKSIYALTHMAAKNLLTPVGKMQRNSSGLLLMTNDNSLLGNLNGSGRMSQLYHVELDKPLNKIDFDKILDGVYIDMHMVKVQELAYVEDSNKREVGLKLNSQKKGIVLRIFESLGYKVNKLDRVTFAGLTKKDLPRGTWRSLTKQELINLQMMA